MTVICDVVLLVKDRADEQLIDAIVNSGLEVDSKRLGIVLLADKYGDGPAHWEVFAGTLYYVSQEKIVVWWKDLRRDWPNTAMTLVIDHDHSDRPEIFAAGMGMTL